MHVFIDTNILLNFYHYSKDDLDALGDLFASHEHGSAKVHLTEQVRNEFSRNRENKIRDALKRFNDVNIPPQLPSFMRGYEEFEQIRRLSNKLIEKRKQILAKTLDDISHRNLLADPLIGDIFRTSELAKISSDVFEHAQTRIALGNPPGKNRSLGDAVNWELLLISVPHGEDIHVVSEDGDFYSVLNADAPSPFLLHEWKTAKSGVLYVYRTLTSFIEKHFDGVAFSFDKNKDALIRSLFDTGSFADSHAVVAELEAYTYFSLRQVQQVLDAANENGQFGGIVTDDDIKAFLLRVAGPHIQSISKAEHRSVLDAIVEYDAEVDDDD